jgi:hypothetical protein
MVVPVMKPRRCRVEAVIERPEVPPWIVHPLPPHEPADHWPGWLLAWRWTDQGKGLWTGQVQYRRDGLTYEHTVSGELLTVEPDVDEGDTPNAPGQAWS